MLTEDDVRQMIRDRAGDSVAAWARANGFTQSYVAKVLRGEAHVSDPLGRKVGLMRKVLFVSCNSATDGANK